MGKSTMSFIKGMLAGAVAGMAIAAIGCEALHKDGRKIKKGAKKAISAMEDLVTEVEELLGK